MHALYNILWTVKMRFILLLDLSPLQYYFSACRLIKNLCFNLHYEIFRWMLGKQHDRY